MYKLCPLLCSSLNPCMWQFDNLDLRVVSSLILYWGLWVVSLYVGFFMWVFTLDLPSCLGSLCLGCLLIWSLPYLILSLYFGFVLLLFCQGLCFILMSLFLFGSWSPWVHLLHGYFAPSFFNWFTFSWHEVKFIDYHVFFVPLSSPTVQFI